MMGGFQGGPMKAIEALKQLKYLVKKADDLQTKIGANSADMEFDQPLAPDMKAKVSEWLQAHTDICREIGRLRYRLQKTNVMTSLTINLNGVDVTKSMFEWIQRRKDLAKMELRAWEKLTDRNLRDGQYQQTNGQTSIMKMRRYYDPQEKERKINLLTGEPVQIDAALEIANCSTDLLE
jgi:hypothetical protein